MAEQAGKIIAMRAPVAIKAAEGESEGPAKFDVTAYNGGALSVDGWDLPVIIDLAGLKMSRNVVANYGHDDDRPVGHVTDHEISESSLKLSGVFSFDEEPATRRILNGFKNKFDWEASVEVAPDKYEAIEAGQVTTANGQEFEGPCYVTREGTLYGFGFVLHGADATTSVAIAASAAKAKEPTMDSEFKLWAENMLPGVDIEAMPEQARTNLQADWEGRKGEREKPAVVATKGDGLGKRKLEADRRKAINRISEQWSDEAMDMGRYDDIEAIREARDEAIKGTISAHDFERELKIVTLSLGPPMIHTPPGTRAVTSRVLEAAICQHGKLKEIDKHFDDQIQQLAHDEYKGRISLRDVYLAGAQANGYNGRVGQVDLEMHNAAFGLGGGRPMVKGFGFSTINLPNVFSNVANKFIREGWMSVDQTALRIAAIRSVSDFKAITTVSLTGGMQFLPIGPDGELKHGELGEQTYSNQVAPAGIMFAITFVDIRNDDIGALTAVPRRIGRGGMLYLNHIFWTEFLNNSAFFVAGNNNVNTGVADMTIGGLSATETIFMDQVDYDGKPLATEPRILLVPTPLKASATAFMSDQPLITGASATIPAANVFSGRFRVESSPYMSNSSYTGYSATAWYLLADPSDVPVIEIAALDGQVQPTVETADAAFNVLGTQMRGHSHVGVNLQEPKGGVRADGGSS